MKRILLLLGLALVLAPGTFVRDPPQPPNTSQAIRFEPLMVSDMPDRVRRRGALWLVAAWEMTSDNTDFGGLSALAARDDGSFLALSDNAYLVGFSLPGRETGRRDFIAPLPFGGEQARFKEERDSESLVADFERARFWVGFEQHHGVRRYNGSFARIEAEAFPKPMQDWPANGGAEAMVELADGRFLVFSEEKSSPRGGTVGLIFPGDPTMGGRPRAFALQSPSGYKITDIAALPDGRLILLHRRFRITEGVSARVTIGDPADIVPGQLWTPKLIAALEPPFPVDNMEGITATVENGRTMVWMVSDDNFNPIQRTLLLKFVLREGGAGAAPGFSVR